VDLDKACGQVAIRTIEMTAGDLFTGSGKAKDIGGFGWGGADQQFVGYSKVLAQIRNVACRGRAGDDSDNTAALHIGLRAGTK
jgi:hypothetical protein